MRNREEIVNLKIKGPPFGYCAFPRKVARLSGVSNPTGEDSAFSPLWCRWGLSTASRQHTAGSIILHWSTLRTAFLGFIQPKAHYVLLKKHSCILVRNNLERGTHSRSHQKLVFLRRTARVRRKGEPIHVTNQKANCAANLFTIHFSHFHAVPKNRKRESHSELPFTGKT